MKPDINIALMLCAQEIATRFLPLLKEEYDQSRLGSWGAMILLSSLQIDGAADNLNKENKLMLDWLTKTKNIINAEDLIQKVEEVESSQLSDIKISTLDLFNQKLRMIFVEIQEYLEGSEDPEYLKESWIILREAWSSKGKSHAGSIKI
jgi:hypothetical protein